MTPERAQLNEAMRRDLYTYVRRVFADLNPGRKFHLSQHIEYVCAEVTAMYTGEVRRLIVNLPPRNLKSIIVSVAFITWVLGHDPSKRFLLVSYGQDLPSAFSRDCLRIMTSAWYRELFRKTRIDPNANRVDDFRTTRNGGLKVDSVQGAVTGFGADYIIIDDPMKPIDARTDVSRTKVNETIQNTVLSRQDGVGAARVLLVAQRIHEDDPTGYLMSHQPWRRIRLPALAEEDEAYPYIDAFGKRRVFRRKAGEPLNPAYEPLEKLEEQRQIVGEYVWASQYQQRPAPLGGGVFKPDWFRKLPLDKFPAKFDLIFQSWDTGSKDGVTNDYSVCVTIGVVSGVRYILDVFRVKLEFPALREAVLVQRDKHKPDAIVIEAKGSGGELIPELRDLRVWEVVPAMPMVSKVVRAEGQTAIIAGGGVYVPSDADWVEEFLYELAVFPKGRHDDQVDALSQGLQYVRERIHDPNLIAFAKEELAKMRPAPAGGRVRMLAPPGVSHRIRIDGQTELIADGHSDVLPTEVYGLTRAGWKRVS